MSKNYLGNLLEWKDVLDKLEAIRKDGMIDTIQDELVRILRYKKNWKLVEAVLESISEIREPSNNLIKEVFNTAIDYQACLDTRIMAINSLGMMLSSLSNSKENETCIKSKTYVDMMHQLLNTPQPPIFHNAISKVIVKLNNEKECAQAGESGIEP